MPGVPIVKIKVLMLVPPRGKDKRENKVETRPAQTAVYQSPAAEKVAGNVMTIAAYPGTQYKQSLLAGA